MHAVSKPWFSGLLSKVWGAEICQRLFIIIARTVVSRKLWYVSVPMSVILNVPYAIPMQEDRKWTIGSCSPYLECRDTNIGIIHWSNTCYNGAGYWVLCLLLPLHFPIDCM